MNFSFTLSSSNSLCSHFTFAQSYNFIFLKSLASSLCLFLHVPTPSASHCPLQRASLKYTKLKTLSVILFLPCTFFPLGKRFLSSCSNLDQSGMLRCPSSLAISLNLHSEESPYHLILSNAPFSVSHILLFLGVTVIFVDFNNLTKELQK